MKTICSTFALLVLLLGAASSRAETPIVISDATFSTEELARMCRSTHDTDYGYCAGYVTAIAHMMRDNISLSGYRACRHDSVRSQQYIDIFNTYLELYPDSMPREAAVVVAAALARAFPCL